MAAPAVSAPEEPEETTRERAIPDVPSAVQFAIGNPLYVQRHPPLRCSHSTFTVLTLLIREPLLSRTCSTASNCHLKSSPV